MEILSYIGPRTCAETIAKLYPDADQRAKVRILDIAAGTGLVGQEVTLLEISKLH